VKQTQQNHEPQKYSLDMRQLNLTDFIEI